MWRLPRLIRVVLAVMVAWGGWGLSQAVAGEPTDQLQATINKVIDTLKDPQLATPEQVVPRRERLREVIYRRFDFGNMAQGAVGHTWNQFSSAQKDRFIQLFRQILEDAYLDKIESYQGEVFTFTREERPSDGMALIDSVVTSKGKEFKLSYRLGKEGSEWKVHDVVIEGVSLVANYRSQFQDILQRSTVDELIVKLEAKTRKKGGEAGSQ